MTREKAIEALSLLRIFDAPDLNEAVKMAVAALRYQANTLPNAPLTLEELREMGGEEIYTTKEGWIRCWGIGDGHFGPRIETGEGRGLSLIGYGKTWLAYRRKPEEGTA